MKKKSSLTRFFISILPLHLFSHQVIADTIPADSNTNRSIESNCQEIEPVLIALKQNIRSTTPITILAIEKDTRYGLPLGDFWGLLQSCLKNKGIRTASIHTKNLPGPIPLRAYLESLKKRPGFSPNAEWRLNSLNLSGEIAVDRLPSFQVAIHIHFLDSSANTLQIISIPNLFVSKSPSSLTSSLFSRLDGIGNQEITEFHQRVVEGMEKTLLSEAKPKALPGQIFAFKNDLNQANRSQLEELKNIFTDHFGFALIDSSKQTIRLNPYGSLEFHLKNSHYAIDSLIDLQPLVDTKAWDENVYTVVYSTKDPGAVNEKIRKKIIPFSEGSDRFPGLGKLIRREIDTTLANAYGDNRGKPDFEYLAKIFQGGEKSIQIGQLVNPLSSKERHAFILDENSYSEKVRYYRISANDYLKALEEKARMGNRFEVRLNLLRLYQEGNNSDRFWGVVYQNWKTRDTTGKIKFKDEGILLVNFDFEPDASGKEQLKGFRIYYRFWFYRYHTPARLKTPEGKSIVITPSQRVQKDINASFFMAEEIPPGVEFGELKEGKFSADPKARSIIGVNTSLLKVIGEDLEKALP